MFAALEIATGQVTGLCKNRHRHQEFLAFLKHVARAYPSQELHLVMDNYAAHKRVEVRDWLAANPRIHVHFTPTSGSWLNRRSRSAIGRSPAAAASLVRDLCSNLPSSPAGTGEAAVTGANPRTDLDKSTPNVLPSRAQESHP